MNDDDDQPIDFERKQSAQIHNHYYRGGEHHGGSNGNGGWAKVRDLIVGAVILGTGALVLNMNNRLTIMEATIATLVTKIAVHGAP